MQVFFVTGLERPPACNVRIPRKGSEGTLEGGEGSAPAPLSNAWRCATCLLCGQMTARLLLRAPCCCGSDLRATILTCTLVASAGSAGGVGWSMTPTTSDPTTNRTPPTAEMEAIPPFSMGEEACSRVHEAPAVSATFRWKAGADVPAQTPCPAACRSPPPGVPPR